MKIIADFSVVVLTGGRAEHLARCIESIESGSVLPAEIIIVNNDRTGATEDLLQGYAGSLQIRVIAGVKGGYAESRNQGVAATQHARVAFLDDDCLADTWWVEELDRALDEFEAVGGPVLPARDHRTPPDFSPELNWLVGLSTPLLWSEAAGKIETPSTSNVAFHRSVWQREPFQEIGGDLASPKDQRNYLIGREDAHWWRRLRRSGMQTGIAYRAIAWHDFDRGRYAAPIMNSRARSDGRANWKREQPGGELPAAARDIVHYPARVFTDLFRTHDDYRTIRRRHRAWTQRQLALINSAVDDDGHEFSPEKRTALYVKAGVKLIADAAKPAFRHAAVFSHHQFKNLRPMPDAEHPPSAVTVVCYDFLGDAVLAIPMLEELRAAFPRAAISILCGEVAAPIFSALSIVDDVVILPSGMRDKNPRDAAIVWKAMEKTRPDVIILTYFHGAPPIGLFGATRAPVICWERDHGMRQQTWPELASAIVPKSMKKAEVAALMDLLAPMKIETRLHRPRFNPPKRAIARAEEILSRFAVSPGAYAVVHVDADESARKYWPAQNFEIVARWLIDSKELFVFFIGSRSGRRHVEWMNLPEGRSTSLHGMLDAAELAAVQRGARICIGPDSGPQHLAQAVGAPTLILFEATQKARWQPLPRIGADENRQLPFSALAAENACEDWLGCEIESLPASEQIARIQPQAVIAAAEKLLESDG